MGADWRVTRVVGGFVVHFYFRIVLEVGILAGSCEGLKFEAWSLLRTPSTPQLASSGPPSLPAACHPWARRSGAPIHKINLWFDGDSFQYLNHPGQKSCSYLAALTAHY